MKKLLWLSTIVISLGVLFLITGCQNINTATPTGKKSIVVTYSVLGSIVKELVGEQAEVVIAIPDGLDPHEWDPSAKDIAIINKADLVITNGLGLENGLEKTLENAKNNGVKMFAATDYITVRHVGEGEGIPSDDPDQAIGAPDPHFWTDPLTMKNVVGALSNELTRELTLDVAGKALALEQKLDSLSQQISDIVSTIPQSERKLVTGHESMGYFAQRYGFKLTGVIVPGLSSQSEISAASLAELKKAIEENQVKAIFTEIGTSTAVAKTIGDETGVKVIELATHTLPEDGSYFTFVTNLANVITDSLR